MRAGYVAAATLLFAFTAGLAAACGSGDVGETGSGGATASESSSAGAGSPVTTGTSTSTNTGPSTTGSGGGPPMCMAAPWATYGHDAQRTFASEGCIKGPLTTTFKYVPAPLNGKMLGFVSHVIADPMAVYVQWAQTNPPYLGTTSLDRVGLDGMRVWNFDTGTDSNLGNWATLWNDQVIIEDDGVYEIAQADGKQTKTTGVDWWGMTIADPQRLYLVNAEHVDGPGIFVGALDTQLGMVWQQNPFGACRIDAGDLEGGIALDGGVLFYAPSYSFGDGPKATFVSGVYAFDAAMGAPKWNQPTTPASTISAKNGLLYLIETDAMMKKSLVAREQSDGTVAWKVPFGSAGEQAPVLAGNLVIVAHDFMNVGAYDAATGNKVWDVAVQGAQGFAQPLGFSGGCVNGVQTEWKMQTQIAASLGSQTVVVAGQAVSVLSLKDGSTLWMGSPPMGMGPYRDPVIVGDALYVMDSQGAVLATKSM